MELDPSNAFVVERDWSNGGALLVDPATGADLGAVSRGEEQPAEPVPLTVRGRQRMGDLVETTLVGLRLASPRLVDDLAGRGCTGWSSFPVRVSGSRAPEFDGYLGLAVTGRCGVIDDSLSERVSVPLRPGGASRPHLRGLHPVPGSWDGSDLFMPTGATWLCVTGAVRDAWTELGAVGVRFQPMSEVDRWIWDEAHDSA